MKVAVVGSGPAGVYCTKSLLEMVPILRAVTVFEERAVPYGLLRFGVAPDHQALKESTGRVFDRVMGDERVRLQTKKKVTRLSEVQAAFDAVFLCVGAARQRSLELHPAVVPAQQVVAWYNGERATVEDRVCSGHRVTLIGNGNVSVDIARVLLTRFGVAAHVLCQEVNIVARRGPLQAAWTTKELREITSLPQVATHVLHEGPLPPAEGAPRGVKRMLQLLHEIHARRDQRGPLRLNLHFNAQPVEYSDEERVLHTLAGPVASDVVIESPGFVVEQTIQCEPPIPEVDGHFAHEKGRIRDRLYCVGWCKRGSSAHIATNKFDAEETVAQFVADLQ